MMQASTMTDCKISNDAKITITNVSVMQSFHDNRDEDTFYIPVYYIYTQFNINSTRYKSVHMINRATSYFKI